uniref:Uncharacterized protein n=1 Tax=Cacopsylla melanoneura TaxID=428564 RepID=A0A8D8U851_9HEMI
MTPLRLIQDVPTRWNSTYYMFDRVLTLKVPLISAMADLEYESSICHADWQQIAQCRDALRKFEQATKIVSAEKDIVLSKLNYVTERTVGPHYSFDKTLNVAHSSQNSMKFYTRKKVLTIGDVIFKMSS